MAELESTALIQSAPLTLTPWDGLCGCGCGQQTKRAPRTRADAGWVKGQPMRFLKAHHLRLLEKNRWPRWRGGRNVTNEGYVRVQCPGHPRAASNGYVLEHILVVEGAIRKPLPPEAVVHHVNRVRSDNRNENLVACQDQSYHRLLHVRMQALAQKVAV